MDKQSVYSVVPQPGLRRGRKHRRYEREHDGLSSSRCAAPALSVANASENSFTYGEKTGQQIIDDLGAVTATSHTEALMPGGAPPSSKRSRSRTAWPILSTMGSPGVAYNGWSWLAGYRGA